MMAAVLLLLFLTPVVATVIGLRTVFYWMNRAHRAEAKNNPHIGEGPVIYGAARR
jgi:hypothetical protein